MLVYDWQGQHATGEEFRWLIAQGYRHVDHDHFPDNDAEYGCFEYLFVETQRLARRRSQQ